MFVGFQTMIILDSYNMAFDIVVAGNALARVQRVHKPADLWDITFCTR